MSVSARPPRRVALVTGAARRLGRAIALDLGAAGWNVAVHYHGSAADAADCCAQLAERGAAACALHADLADARAARDLVARAEAELGRVDAVVNNASLFEYDDAASFDAARAARHHAVNLVAPVLLAQALHAQLLARGARGCVVNLLDQKLWNPNPDHLSYTLSKAALREATTLLAQALAPALRVVGVAPGLTLGSAQLDAAALARMQRAGPLGDGPHAADIAAAVRFCLDNPALTGSCIVVDAGQHLQPHARDFAFIAERS
jgi:NAD(P)-dependent dehydrogenase (short-subunit alcohol dehydrogenase family)